MKLTQYIYKYKFIIPVEFSRYIKYNYIEEYDFNIIYDLIYLLDYKYKIQKIIISYCADVRNMYFYIHMNNKYYVDIYIHMYYIYSIDLYNNNQIYPSTGCYIDKDIVKKYNIESLYYMITSYIN